MSDNEYIQIKEAVETLKYFNFANYNVEYKEKKWRGTKYITKIYKHPAAPPLNPYLSVGEAEQRVLRFLENTLQEYEQDYEK